MADQEQQGQQVVNVGEDSDVTVEAPPPAPTPDPGASSDDAQRAGRQVAENLEGK